MNETSPSLHEILGKQTADIVVVLDDIMTALSQEPEAESNDISDATKNSLVLESNGANDQTCGPPLVKSNGTSEATSMPPLGQNKDVKVDHLSTSAPSVSPSSKNKDANTLHVSDPSSPETKERNLDHRPSSPKQQQEQLQQPPSSNKRKREQQQQTSGKKRKTTEKQSVEVITQEDAFPASIEREAFPDWRVLPPATFFTFEWTFRNTSDKPWPPGSYVRYKTGSFLSESRRRIIIEEEVGPQQKYTFTLKVRTPARDGSYVGTYWIVSPDEREYFPFWYCFKVDRNWDGAEQQ
eukprot:GILJ01006155.1.p1 GENE.GILJ01006155.1~~GILJ01006155.1.p1  ORF type:complete len:295 (+),score=40.07 GILJ01006155.1:696-1580(+)